MLRIVQEARLRWGALAWMVVVRHPFARAAQEVAWEQRGASVLAARRLWGRPGSCGRVRGSVVCEFGCAREESNRAEDCGAVRRDAFLRIPFAQASDARSEPRACTGRRRRSRQEHLVGVRRALAGTAASLRLALCAFPMTVVVWIACSLFIVLVRCAAPHHQHRWRWHLDSY